MTNKNSPQPIFFMMPKQLAQRNSKPTKAIFLDRDGVINQDHGYVYQPQNFEFISGVFEAAHAFQTAGYLPIVITNQSGIARGYYTEQDLASLSLWMRDQFHQRGIEIAALYYCPHHPNLKPTQPQGTQQTSYIGACKCRKPNPGMVLQALADYQLSAQESIFIGDKESDMLAAQQAGIGTKVLVRSGQTFSEQTAAQADFVFDNIQQAAERLLSPSDFA